MPRSKKLCPFTGNPCSACQILFAEETQEKPGQKTRGCHLVEKSGANK